MTASKQKGTGGETELLRLLNARGYNFRRMPASARWDLEQAGGVGDRPLEVLATRDDRGRWLFTSTLEGIEFGLKPGWAVRMEVKRFKAFAHHRIYDGKFPK